MDVLYKQLRDVEHSVIICENIENPDMCSYLMHLLGVLSPYDIRQLPIKDKLWVCITHADDRLIQRLVKNGFPIDVRYFYMLIQVMIAGHQSNNDIFEQRFKMLFQHACIDGALAVLTYLEKCRAVNQTEKLSSLYNYVVEECIAFRFLVWS